MPNPSPPHYAIVASHFNPSITTLLVTGAETALRAHGIVPPPPLWVPGALELPLACHRLLTRHRPDAIIALGAVIRGETPHFDIVATECARGIARLTIDHDTPIIFGVLTTDTVAQALTRADPTAADRGGTAARAAIQMLTALNTL